MTDKTLPPAPAGAIAEIRDGRLSWHIPDPMYVVPAELRHGVHYLTLSTPTPAPAPARDAREAVARAICTACDEIPDHAGDCQGNDWRWQDYLGAADAAIAAVTHAPATATGKPGLQVEQAQAVPAGAEPVSLAAAVRLGLEYAREALATHDQQFANHPATELERGSIVADIATMEASLAPVAEDQQETILGHSVERGGWCVYTHYHGGDYTFERGPFASREAAEAAMRAPQAPVADDRSSWFAVAMNAAASLEDAANCLRDPDAKASALGAAKHVRGKCNAMWSAPQAPQQAGHIPTVEDIDAQDWAGMDGATAYQVIERHGENWSHIGRLMAAWLAANQAPGMTHAPKPEEPTTYCWSHDGEEYHDECQSREQAAAAALARLEEDGVGEPGELWTIHTAVCRPAMSYLRKAAENIGSDVIERLEEWLCDDIVSDDEIIDIAKDKYKAFGHAILDCLSAHAAFNRYGVGDVEDVEVTLFDAQVTSTGWDKP